jgi:hypothetical protein
LGTNLDESTIARYQRIDAPENIPAIYELATRAAEMQVKRDDLAAAKVQA